MFPHRPEGASDTIDVLASLPSEYRVVDLHGAQFVVGPAGAFVVAAAATDMPLAATALVQRAVRLRAALADHLAWVPFIDALLVAADHSSSALAATTVPADLLAKTLVQGKPMLSEATVSALATLVESLAVITLPPVAFTPPDGRMDPCDSFRPPTAWTLQSTSSAGTAQPSSSSTPTDSTAGSSSHSPVI